MKKVTEGLNFIPSDPFYRTAVFARMFIDIYSIYPQEVIPTDQFFSLLETQTGTQWDYFFTDL